VTPEAAANVLLARARAMLGARTRRVVSDAARRRAAVLVPLYARAGEVYVLCTRRADDLPHHQGQVAFPGGGHEPADDGLLATALREAEEEVGIAARDVEVLGTLDDEATRASGFVVTPFVGVIPFPYPFRPNPAEIVALLHVPIEPLLVSKVFREETRERNGVPARVLCLDHGPHVIWGLTARILRGFAELLRSEPSRPAG
jgi:8-oxo-dGTP pyrophosphatase MutT (NUDIX family)